MERDHDKTRKMKPVGRRRQALTAWLGKSVHSIAQIFVLLVCLAVAFFGIYFVATELIGGDEDGKSKGQEATVAGAIEPTLSSWVEGQESLAAYNQFAEISDRALPLGAALAKARAALIAAIEKARLKEDDSERKAALRAYRRAKRAAERAYQRALAAAERKAEQLARKEARAKARAKRKLEAELARLREKYKVEPGEECSIPEIAAIFDCSTGYPDLTPPKPKK